MSEHSWFAKLVAIPVFMVVRGLAVLVGYDWFVKPLLAHPPHMRLIEAIGLSLFIGLFTGRQSHADDRERAKMGPTITLHHEIAFGAIFYAYYFVLALLVHSLS